MVTVVVVLVLVVETVLDDDSLGVFCGGSDDDDELLFESCMRCAWLFEVVALLVFVVIKLVLADDDELR